MGSTQGSTLGSEQLVGSAAGSIRAQIGTVIFAVVAAALLSGCMTLDLSVDLKSNGSGVLTFNTTIPQQLIGFMEMAGEQVDEDFVRQEFLKDAPSDVADRIDVTVEKSDSGLSIKLHIRFASLDELNSAMTDGVDSGPLFTEFNVSKESDKWVFTASPADLTAATTGGPVEGGDDVFGGENPFEDMFGDPDVSFTLNFPGKVTESNATAVKGNSATWKIDGATSEQLTARADLGGGPNMMLIGGLVIAVAVVIVVIGIVIGRSRSSKKSNGPGVGGSPSGVGTSAYGPAPGGFGSAHMGGTAGFGSPPIPGSGPITGSGSGFGATGGVGSLPPIASPTQPGQPAWPTQPGQTAWPSQPASPSEPNPPDLSTGIADGPAADWYPDPWGKAQWRWYDGRQWTDQTA